MSTEHTTKTILVTGGTGTLGRLVTERLRLAGYEVRVLSRHSQPYAVDLREGGPALDAALDGVDTVVHCATTPRGDDDSTRNLVAAAGRAGVRHLVYISIVGVDRVPFPYYRTKLACEKIVEGSGLGWTILRTTQFHDLVHRFLALFAKAPVMLVLGGVSDQPIEVAEVADRLCELAAGEPAGRVPDMGGPEVHTFTHLARAYLAASGRRRPLLPVRLPGKTYRAFVAGGHLTPERAVGKRTFAEFLAGTGKGA
ncbi:NAD(P)H-binding protein [Streptomyces sp. NPDC048623]|uniref:SDR family oxidoreductase n=1 Tax=Streptomyces sp. NPDC048623 TaxID=3155761 RepID=UPI00343767AE